MTDLRHMLPGEVREYLCTKVIAVHSANLHTTCDRCMFNDPATPPCPVAKSALDCLQHNQVHLGSVFFMEENEYLKARLKGLV